MKIGILFNCQHEGLRLSMKALRPDDEVISYGFPELASSAALKTKAYAALRQCDVIVVKPTRNIVKPAEIESFKSAAKQFMMLPSINFAGYHPDIVYLSGVPGQIRGPTEALHSRIAIVGHLAGLSVAETAKLYNKLVFARLTYFRRFNEQLTLLKERFETYAVDVGPSG